MSAVAKAIVQKAAPFFKGQAYYNTGFKQVQLTDFKDRYLLMFFYPLNFTYVCPTEIIDFSRHAAEFRKAGCDILGVSVDSHFSHQEYAKKPRAEGGLGGIDFGLLSDTTH